MSAEAVSTAVGEDGIKVAVDALKEIAAGGLPDSGDFPRAEHRVEAAQTLLRYGLAHVDAFGNQAA